MINWSLHRATRFKISPSRWRTSKVEIFSVIVTTTIVVTIKQVKQKNLMTVLLTAK
jgi:hypothetical protein